MKTRRAKILCIDDDAYTCNWIRVMLRGAKIDASITVVKSGSEAFWKLFRESFDLCILDYALPDMTGVQLCTSARRVGIDVPMMFFTAMSRTIDRERASAAGASEFLSKPDDLDKFIPVVQRLLRHRIPFRTVGPRTVAIQQAA